MSVDPTIVREAMRLGIASRRDALRYLLHPPPKCEPWLAPRILPPPERLALVQRPDGRVRRTPARMTRALIVAGVVNPTTVKNYRPPEAP